MPLPLVLSYPVPHHAVLHRLEIMIHYEHTRAFESLPQIFVGPSFRVLLAEYLQLWVFLDVLLISIYMQLPFPLLITLQIVFRK